MKLLSLTEKIKLTKQQELEFIDVLEDDIKKYFRIPIFFIMLFQIYKYGLCKCLYGFYLLYQVK